MSEETFYQIKEPNERSFWKKLKKVAARIPFTSDLLAAWYCAADPSTPSRVRIILMGAIGYFMLPTDTVPDLIAGLGFADDATVLAMAFSAVASHIKPEHRQRAEKAIEELGAD
jgi:uncharacterized membrane protein YkvA (DUF1232 family)